MLTGERKMNNILLNPPKYPTMSDPWDLPLSPISDSEINISHCVTPWLTANPEKIPLTLSPVNPPETLLLTTHSESFGQILWQDWLRLPKPITEELTNNLSQMWGLLYWQEHLI
jgi:hypothetical protein